MRIIYTVLPCNLIQARLAKKKKKNFWPAFVTRLLTPCFHENPAMDFFWGVDQDHH